MKVSALMSLKPPPSPRRVQPDIRPDDRPVAPPPARRRRSDSDGLRAPRTPSTTPQARVRTGRPPLLQRLLDVLLSDFWIDVLLMLFIFCSMLFLHQ